MANWRAILDGDLAERVRGRIEIVLRELQRAQRGDRARASLDDPWIALLYAYAWAADRDREDLQEHTQELLSDLHRRLEQGISSPSLWGGLAGVAWLNAHVDRVFAAAEPEPRPDDPEHPDDDPEDPEDAEDAEDAGVVLDGLLTQLVRVNPPAHYDLISGLAGIGMVGIERGAAATAGALVDAVVDELARRGRRDDPPGTTLLTPPELLPPWQRAIAPGGYLNLGVAHGVPGVIGFLAHTCAAGHAAGTARPLLEELVEWTLACRDRSARAGGGFSGWVLPGSRQPDQVGSRTAWCYGGLGVGAVLVLAGQLADRPDWLSEGVDICLAEAAIPVEESGVIDVGLCHGAAGNAHIFNRLFQATGDERFRGAALRYYARLLDYADDTRGIGGYVAHDAIPGTGGDGRRPQLGPVDDASFLTGSTGIGLALLAGISDLEPRWDRLLLMDLPPGP